MRNRCNKIVSVGMRRQLNERGMCTADRLLRILSRWLETAQIVLIYIRVFLCARRRWQRRKAPDVSRKLWKHVEHSGNVFGLSLR